MLLVHRALNGDLSFIEQLEKLNNMAMMSGAMRILPPPTQDKEDHVEVEKNT